MDEKAGRLALGIARRTIEAWVRKHEAYEPKEYPAEFKEERGVFVSIHTWPDRELRGCIGYPEPVMPLIDALTQAAIAAAVHDPRFDPLGRAELGKVIIEVSVLTKPEPITVKTPKDYARRVKVGRDGLIVRHGFRSGLLLPQVATEYDWNAEEFLSQTCVKAGLPPDAWLDETTRVYSFRSDVFSEKKPGR